MTSGQLLSVPAAAISAGISPELLRKEIAAGLGPATLTIGKRIRIASDDLDAWLDARRHVPKSAQPTEAA